MPSMAIDQTIAILASGLRCRTNRSPQQLMDTTVGTEQPLVSLAGAHEPKVRRAPVYGTKMTPGATDLIDTNQPWTPPPLTGFGLSTTGRFWGVH